MPNNARTVVATVSSLLLLLLLLVNALHSCAGVRIPTRFSHNKYIGDNVDTQLHHQQRRSVEESAYQSSSGEAQLKSREESLTANSIPMEFYEELDNVTDIYEFIERFVVDKDSIDPKLGIQVNLKENVQRASSMVPKPANCIPASTIVPLTPLAPSKDPEIIYYPKCTRVNRCGGCCSSELMACQPTELVVVNFEVTKYRYGARTPLVGKEIIPVEEHLKCKCDCRIKAEDCKSYQIYRRDHCRCSCINNDAMDKCKMDHKLWDENDCRCVCRDSQSCTTGTIFDESQCKCVTPGESYGGGNVPALADRRRFIVKAVPIEPDNSTLYTSWLCYGPPQSELRSESYCENSKFPSLMDFLASIGEMLFIPNFDTKTENIDILQYSEF